ncbi:WXG100 family type VII secretion target [Amycolatopsis sp. FDAARGOS 1241]|uniref:WXG100 family type VII secretion target n=1 Tax=Amycolatopsis sp. FDAARGOS 1241 TaxID=2778070 RepID=UPI00195163BE|nr:WXG100 family type VII secretion target [Amycolatopsis sp. FDAARGOS 1241]QRP46391.1 WXG100 family type VII secretion target [Amycolatopsis sp. FDAARGOS 1241]
MALGQFTINFTEMGTTTASAKQQSQQITELLEQMKKTIDSQRESWTGVAADEFQAAYTYCHQLALSLPQALDHAAATLQNINDGTHTTEQGNAQRFAVQ